MSTNPIDMLQTKGQMQAQDLELKQNQITALKKNISPAEKEKKLREACEGFESIFIQKMWTQMRATLPQENPLVGREEKFWQSMYDQELAKEMASSGGIGLADMMYNQLSKNLAAASRSTADTVSKTKGFEISATPLMPMENANLAVTTLKQDVNMAQGSGNQNSANQLVANQVQTGQVKTSEAKASQAHTGEAQPRQVAKATPSQPHNIYEGAAPHMGTNPHDVTTAQTQNANNNAIVEQYVANLQAKQAGTSLPTGPELAQRAKLVAANTPPAQGVLPNPNTSMTGHALQMHNAFVQPNMNANLATANTGLRANPASSTGAALLQSQISGQPMAGTEPHVIRTTYTTNIPPNERSKRKVNIQHLTSGQPMVRNVTNSAHAYGSRNVSSSAEQVRAAIANQQASAPVAPTGPVTGPVISSPEGPVVVPLTNQPSSQSVSQSVSQSTGAASLAGQVAQSTQAPVVGNTVLSKNIDEG